MKNKKPVWYAIATVTKTKAKTVSGEVITVPTLQQVKKQYGDLAVTCPRFELAQAGKALKYGLKPMVSDKGFISIPGWDWLAQKPVALSAVQGLSKATQRHAIAMMNHSGFMGRESQSADGLVDSAVGKLYGKV